MLPNRVSGEYLTTHQVAVLLGISLPTVINWVKAGRINAHRTPGGHRRISRSELRRFSIEFDYPLPDSFKAKLNDDGILIIGAESDFVRVVQDYLLVRAEYSVKTANDMFEAGFILGRFRPKLVLMEIHLPGIDVRSVLNLIREQSGALIYGCGAIRNAQLSPLLDGWVEKPIVWDKLTEQVQEVFSN